MRLDLIFPFCLLFALCFLVIFLFLCFPSHIHHIFFVTLVFPFIFLFSTVYYYFYYFLFIIIYWKQIILVEFLWFSGFQALFVALSWCLFTIMMNVWNLHNFSGLKTHKTAWIHLCWHFVLSDCDFFSMETHLLTLASKNQLTHPTTSELRVRQNWKWIKCRSCIQAVKKEVKYKRMNGTCYVFIQNVKIADSSKSSEWMSESLNGKYSNMEKERDGFIH